MSHHSEASSPSTTPMEVDQFLMPTKHPRVSNIVCGINLDCRLDHRHIANSGRYYNNTGPARGNNGARFPAAVLRMKEPKATALVFDSGKMQVLGAKSVSEAKLAIRKFARILQKMGYQPRLDFSDKGTFKVQNIVANVDTQMLIRLEGLASEHRPFAYYMPESFPGLSYQVANPKVTLLVFAKGKVVFVGAKNVEDIHVAWEKMWPVLLNYRRT